MHSGSSWTCQKTKRNRTLLKFGIWNWTWNYFSMWMRSKFVNESRKRRVSATELKATALWFLPARRCGLSSKFKGQVWRPRACPCKDGGTFDERRSWMSPSPHSLAQFPPYGCDTTLYCFYVEQDDTPNKFKSLKFKQIGRLVADWV